MAKKIVVLNGSPRPNGNTAMLINAFTEGAEQAGNTVETFFLDGMEIHGCKGCYGGGKDPASPCVQKDDMDKIYPVYKEADVVVMASPLYYWMMSGQLRTAFDRLFAVVESEGFKSSKKDCVLLMAAGGKDFDEAVYYYNSLMRRLGWNNLGTVLAGDVNDAGEAEGTPVLDEARQLGFSIK